MFVNGRWLNLDVAGLAIKRHQFQRDGTLSPFLREDGTQSGWSGGERVVASNLKNDRGDAIEPCLGGPWSLEKGYDGRNMRRRQRSLE